MTVIYAQEWQQATKAEFRLLSDRTQITNKQTEMMLGLDVRLEKGWKIYWRTPGKGGKPPTLDFSNSDIDIKGDLLFPTPQRSLLLGVESFSYSDNVLFPININIDDDLISGQTKNIIIDVYYFICADICIPARVTLHHTLNIGDEYIINQDQKFLLSKAVSLLPQPVASISHITIDDMSWQQQNQQYGIALTINNLPNNHKFKDIFIENDDDNRWFLTPDITYQYPQSYIFLPQENQEIITKPSNKILATIAISAPSGDYAVETSLSPIPIIPIATKTKNSNLLLILLFAFIGGVILNIMPCVLPVIAMKLFHIAKLRETSQNPTTLKLNMLSMSSGIIFGFLILAFIMILIKFLGGFAGWGVQFQHLEFLIAILISFVFYCAILLDICTITPPQFLVNRLNHYADKHQGESFFSGLLAVVMATPCSAPFVGTAISYGLQGHWYDTLLIFFVMGVGLASPFIIAMMIPSFINIIPKPGKWMNNVKIIFAFFFMLSIAWLLWIIALNHGNAAALSAFSLSFAIFMLLYLRGRKVFFANGVTIGFFVVLAVLMPQLAFYSRDDSEKNIDKNIYDWQKFSPSAIDNYLTQGRIVFVDITADWCITCQFNKQHILHDDDMIALFKKHNVVMMQGDWSLPNDDIANYIQSFGRYGIPLNVIYHPNQTPITLPELLSKDDITKLLQ